MLDTATAVKVRSLVAGAWVDGHGATLAVRDPATSEEALLVEAAMPAEVEAAVAAAREAQDGWAETAARRRGEVLFEAADELERRREEFALRLTPEMGKVLAESRAETDEALFLRFMAGEGARLAGETRPSVDRRRLALAEQAPAGVVGRSIYLAAPEEPSHPSSSRS